VQKSADRAIGGTNVVIRTYSKCGWRGFVGVYACPHYSVLSLAVSNNCSGTISRTSHLFSCNPHLAGKRSPLSTRDLLYPWRCRSCPFSASFSLPTCNSPKASLSLRRSAYYWLCLTTTGIAT